MARDGGHVAVTGKMTPRKAPPVDESEALATALLVSGIGLLVYAVAPPELRAVIRGVLRGARRPATKPLDLADKYPDAIEVP